jgi:hypothetical protein
MHTAASTGKYRPAPQDLLIVGVVVELLPAAVEQAVSATEYFGETGLVVGHYCGQVDQAIQKVPSGQGVQTYGVFDVSA